jgi:hypothetical protein
VAESLLPPFWVDVLHLVVLAEGTVGLVCLVAMFTACVKHQREVRAYLDIAKGWADIARQANVETKRAVTATAQEVKSTVQSALADAAAISKH